MKKIFFIVFLSLTSLIIVPVMANAQTKSANPVLRHVVLFKFKDDATPADVKKVEDAFVALKGKIKLIKSFEWGLNNSPEKLNQGLTHAFIATFASEKDRDAYLVHPDHVAFTKIAGPVIDTVTVVDFWVK